MNTVFHAVAWFGSNESLSLGTLDEAYKSADEFQDNKPGIAVIITEHRMIGDGSVIEASNLSEIRRDTRTSEWQTII